MERFTKGYKLDFTQLFRDLSSVGATSFKILDENLRLSLLQEAQGYTYRPLPEIVGSGENIVKQQMGNFTDFPSDSRFIALKDSFQTWLEARLRSIEQYPFEIPLDLNSIELAKYEAGSLGITPHRDGFKYKNLICIFMIAGRGKFYICSDRAGNDAREIEASPGRVILMKAPGFLGETDRPFHFVTDIAEIRYIFGLRQVIPPG